MMRTLLRACVTCVACLTFGCGPAPTPCDPDTLTNAAQVCPDRDSLGFGQEFGSGTFLGTSVEDNLAVRNGGIADLHIQSANLSGDPAFTLTTSETTPASIRGNRSFLMRVFFTPTEAKAYSAEITLISDAENSPTRTFRVSGCGVPSDGGVSPCYRAGDGGP